MSEAGTINPIAVIGIGNEFRSDDGLGIWLVRELQKRNALVPAATYFEASGEGSALMEIWSDFDNVIIFDAVMKHHEPGKVTHLVAEKDRIPSDVFNYSSHAFSLAEAIELSRVLGQLPSRMDIFGVEGQCFSHGLQLSDQVLASCEELVNFFCGVSNNRFNFSVNHSMIGN